MSITKKSLFTTMFALPILGFLGIASMPTEAVAGFKWNAPSKNSKAEFPKGALKSKSSDDMIIHWGKRPVTEKTTEAEMPKVEEALPAPVSMETLENLKEAEANTAEKTTTEVPVANDVISEVINEDHHKQASNSTPPSPEAKTVILPPDFHIDGAETIQGFGKEVPLVLAIRQIIPANRAFAFDKNVNLAMRVDWNGGKAWDEVLNDTLFEHKLAASEHDGIIIIGPAPTKTIKPPPPPHPEMTDIVKDAPVWRAYKGQTLHNIIKAWSDREHVELFWNTDYDYRLHKDLELEGSYEEVLGSLLDEFSELSPQPYGKLSKKENGQRVLTINIYDMM